MPFEKPTDAQLENRFVHHPPNLDEAMMLANAAIARNE